MNGSLDDSFGLGPFVYFIIADKDLKVSPLSSASSLVGM